MCSRSWSRRSSPSPASMAVPERRSVRPRAGSRREQLLEDLVVRARPGREPERPRPAPPAPNRARRVGSLRPVSNGCGEAGRRRARARRRAARPRRRRSRTPSCELELGQLGERLEVGAPGAPPGPRGSAARRPRRSAAEMSARTRRRRGRAAGRRRGRGSPARAGARGPPRARGSARRRASPAQRPRPSRPRSPRSSASSEPSNPAPEPGRGPRTAAGHRHRRRRAARRLRPGGASGDPGSHRPHTSFAPCASRGPTGTSSSRTRATRRPTSARLPERARRRGA